MTKTDQFGGWHFPAGEAHLPAWLRKVGDWRENSATKDRRLLYQGAKYRRAISLCTNHRAALDVGGHVGLWSWQMAMDFARVWAFEPMPDHRACYELNMCDFKNWTLFPFALGEKAAVVGMHVPAFQGVVNESSGGTGVDPKGEGLKVEMRRLDEFALNEIDFMKIDCEGFEYFVLQGGIETLKRNKPVVIVEQKPEHDMSKYGIETKDAVKFLQSLGARQAFEMAGDHIMTW